MHLIIVDECFVAGTQIETPSGAVSIETLKAGDCVNCADGVGTVSAVMSKTASKILKIGLSNGDTIECTANHPFFTEQGWTKAEKLEVGDGLVSAKALQEMRDCYEARYKNRQEWQGVRESGEGKLGSAALLLQILREESKQPNAQCSESSKDVDYVEKNWAQAETAGRQRKRANDSSVANAKHARTRLGDGAHSGYKDSNLLGQTDAAPLQHRRSESRNENSNRGRRDVALREGASRARREERCFFADVWVESIKAEEQRGDRAVYNLEVAEHPSYFANGVLVHNCHIQHKVRDELAMLYPNATILGLTATPFSKGLGTFYTDVVSAISMKQLIAEGYLSDYRAFAPFVPDMSGVKQTAGDWTKDAAADVYEPEIIGDLVTHWKQHAADRPTLAFGCNVAHSKAIADKFQQAGVRAAHIDGYGGDTEKLEREQIIAKYKRGEIQMLCSVGILCKGFDAPLTSCLIIARPTKSLSLHLQIIGRGLRTFAGKDDCLILDHAGNFVRHGFPEDITDFTLCDGTKASSKDKRDKGEKLPVPCPSCQALKTAHRCPACGFAPEKQNEIVNVDGELVELARAEAASKKSRSKEMTMDQKQRFYSELLGWAQHKGYKEGWAANQYRQRLDVWPNQLQKTPASTSIETQSWIKSQQIRYAKGREKANAA